MRIRPDSAGEETWPELPTPEEWRESYETLHRWTQIVGKVRLEKAPWVNHSWHVTLYVTPHGLTTSAIDDGLDTFEITFDFVDHRLRISTSRGERGSFALEPMSVAQFYSKTEGFLEELGIEVEMRPMPVEIPDPIEPFPDDESHAAYEAPPVRRIWQALRNAQRVFADFRSHFIGKVSPVHFFWGAFDLAVTRFSGREAPTHPGGIPNCADWVMEEAYSHELSSAGFWPGAGFGEPAFYSYVYPEPDGYTDYPVSPDAAQYLEELGEFVLPYEAVRTAEKPDALLLEFLQTSYEAAAELGDWDREALERTSGPPNYPV